MFQYLLDDYFRGYNLPQIRKESISYRLIAKYGITVVRSRDSEEVYHSPTGCDIIAIGQDRYEWRSKPVVLFSDRTHCVLGLKKLKPGRVPPKTLQPYILI